MTEFLRLNLQPGTNDDPFSYRLGKKRLVKKARKPSKLKQIILNERNEKEEAARASTGDCPQDGQEIQEPRPRSASKSPVNTAQRSRGGGSKGETPPRLDTNRHTIPGAQSRRKAKPGTTDTLEAADLPRRQRNPCLEGRGKNLEVRGYVHQILNEQLDSKVKDLLSDLARFQERLRAMNPQKYQKQKRFVVGIREVQRALRRSKLKALIVVPNLEHIQSENGLNDIVQALVGECTTKEVPVIYALSRNRLGKAIGKNMRLSMVGILNIEGGFQTFKEIVRIASELREEWVTRQAASLTAVLNMIAPPSDSDDSDASDVSDAPDAPDEKP